MAYKTIFATQKKTTSSGRYARLFSANKNTDNNNIDTKEVSDKEEPKIFTLPEHLGGGQYSAKNNDDGTFTLIPREYAGLDTKEGAERDHIVPVSLGGTSNKENLQYLDSPLGSGMSDEEVKTRQEGKMSVEWDAIEEYKAGKINREQALMKILQKQREITGLVPEQGVMDNLWDGVKEAVVDPVKSLKKLFTNKDGKETINKEGEQAIEELVKTADSMRFEVGEGLDNTTEVLPGPRKSTLEAIKRGDDVKVVPVGSEEKISEAGIAKTVTRYKPLFTPKNSLSETAADIAKAVVQAPQRAVTAVALEPAAEIVSLVKGESVDPIYIPQTKLEEFIFGDTPITGIFSSTDKTQKIVKEYLDNHGLNSDFGTGASLAIAPMVMGTLTGLDLTLFGGEKNTAKVLAKLDNVDEVVSTLKNIGVSDDIAVTVGPKIAATSDVNEISAALKKLNDLKIITKSATVKSAEKNIDSAIKTTDGDAIISEYASKEIDRLENIKNGYSRMIQGDPDNQAVKDAIKRTQEKIDYIKGLSNVEDSVNAQMGNLSKELSNVDSKIKSSVVKGGSLSEKEIKNIVNKDKTLLQRAKEAISPVKHLDEDIQKIYQNKVKADLVAKERANKLMLELPKMADVNTIFKYQAGKLDMETSNTIKKIFDDLYEEARKRGFEIPYREGYLPQVYRENEDGVKKAFARYLNDNGVDKKTIENYINAGGDIPESVGKSLTLNPFMTKEKKFETYLDALEYGLTPRYTDIGQLAAHYLHQLELATNNKKFLRELKLLGKVKDADQAARGWKALELSFHPSGLFADPDLARVLNDKFKPDDALDFWDKSFNAAAGVSKWMQEVVLSAGIPGTSINFFALGQLVKNMTALEFKSLTNFVRSNFNKASIRWFNDNMDVIARMAEEGIDISGRVGNYQGVYEDLGKHFKKLTTKEKFGFVWDKAFSEKTFNSFMAQNMVQTFKDVERKAVKKMSSKEAQKLAGDTTKTFYGIIEDYARSEKTNDILSSVFFAPKFREGLIQTLGNTVKSISTDYKNPAFRKNRTLIGGMIVSYGLYNVLNNELTGHYMWDNPPGKEFELMIIRDNGDVVYTPFMPSFLAFPRNMVSGVIAAAKGDIDTAAQKAGSLMSMPMKLSLELYSNQDYFGRQIYDPEASTEEKIKQIVGYVFGFSEKGASGGINHPYIREMANQLFYKNKPLYQSVSEMLELPFKFSSMDSVRLQEIYRAEDEKKKEEKKEKSKFEPTYESIVKLIEDGDIEEAQRIVNNLSDEDYKIYKYFRKNDKRKDALKMQINVKPVYDRIQLLLEEGDEAEAQKLVDSLTDEEYEAYKALKKKID